MEVRPGYKLTEVGVIPKDWEVLPFKELFKISAGGDLNPRLSSSDQDEIHCFPIYSNALTDRGLYGYCSYADHPAHSITITARGTLGVATYRDHQYSAIGRVLVLEPKQKAAGRFFAELINYRINFAIESTGVPQLTAPQIGGYSLVVPHYPDQRAIATVVSNVDALVGALEGLIAKKRDLKQAAMQQLLTGQTRLPGFSGEWKLRRLGDVAPLQRGFDLPNPLLQPGPYPVVYSNGVLHYHKTFRVTGPGVVTGRSGTIGKVTFVEEDYWPHNTSLWVTSFRDNSPKFVFYLYTRLRFDRFASGSGVPTLNRNDVHAFEVLIPPTIEEQNAIAGALMDMDAEIEALEQRLTKTRDLKQAMMQELLTGRIRLVTPEARYA